MIKLMYITNNVDIAKIAENAGVERIFVDMEYIGKDLRQGGKDTVQNHHTIADVKRIKGCLTRAELLVRCNPIHGKVDGYSSKEEIDAIVESGADAIMLPYFKTADEVKVFIDLVGGRTKTVPLIETPEAVEVIDEILKIEGIDEIFIGLNDLSLGYGKTFMFELLSDGTVEGLCNKFKQKGIPYGFGGIASIGKGLLRSEHIIKEHYRLGSTNAILSRSFCNAEAIEDLQEIENIFKFKLKEIRDFEESLIQKSADYFDKNKDELCHIVENIVRRKRHG